MRMLSAEEHIVGVLNLAVPSPIFKETEPIVVTRNGKLSVWIVSREFCCVFD